MLPMSFTSHLIDPCAIFKTTLVAIYLNVKDLRSSDFAATSGALHQHRRIRAWSPYFESLQRFHTSVSKRLGMRASTRTMYSGCLQAFSMYLTRCDRVADSSVAVLQAHCNTTEAVC